jgi:hypothetical protein
MLAMESNQIVKLNGLETFAILLKPYGRAKHVFCYGNLSRTLNFMIWRHSLASHRFDSPRHFPVKQVNSFLYSIREHTEHEMVTAKETMPLLVCI